MRVLLVALSAIFLSHLSAAAVAATYQIDTLSYACTTDCNNFGPNPGATVDLWGTITTDSDAGFISVSNIVDWAITIDGPENPAMTYTPTDNTELVPGILRLDGSEFTAAGSGVQIYADGTNFAVTMLPGAPNTTSVFRFLATGLAFEIAPVALSQLAFIVETDAGGNSELHRSITSRDPLISSNALLQYDTGVEDQSLLDGFVAMTGSVTEVSTVPLPAAFLLHGAGVFLLGMFGMRRKTGATA